MFEYTGRVFLWVEVRDGIVLCKYPRVWYIIKCNEKCSTSHSSDGMFHILSVVNGLNIEPKNRKRALPQEGSLH